MEQNNNKRRKIDQVTTQSDSNPAELVETYLIVTNLEMENNDDHVSYLIPKTLYKEYKPLIKGYCSHSWQDHSPYTREDITKLKGLEAVKNYFENMSIAFPGEEGDDSQEYCEDDDEFREDMDFVLLWFKVLGFWTRNEMVTKLIDNDSCDKPVRITKFRDFVIDF